ncbi:VacJ family lipoprotein [Erythrobacter sp. MTPC3]|uniref:MlaA family lipoprotein n=1 Tax=Erythrobacter sp. MTPC3 TaxID=3056564 RepID=UPI0036F24E14
MPAFPLTAITSPLLIGQIPAAEVPMHAEPPIQQAAQIARLPRKEPAAFGPVMWIDWSLAQQEPQIESQTAEGEPGQGQTGQGQTEGEEPEDGNVIIVEGTYGPPEGDPLVELNEQAFELTQDVDRIFVEPLADAYEDGLPNVLRTGLRNVVRNLGEPVNALNFLLQLKIGKAFETLGRFGINSTLGLGGLIDMADKPGIGLPYRRNGFANTMGYYGVGSGPYMVIPLAGSTSLRDVIGSTLDNSLLPLAVGKPLNSPEVGVPLFVVSQLQARLEIDERLERVNSSIDPYATMREGYLAEREAEIEEFRVGSPLQGIPDSERKRENRNDTEYSDGFEDEFPIDLGPGAEGEAEDEAGAAPDPAMLSLFTKPERVLITSQRTALNLAGDDRHTR